MNIVEFLSMVTKAADVIKELTVAIFSNVIGWYLLASSAWRLVKWHDQRRQYGGASILVRSVVGTLFIQSATYLNMVALTVTGYDLPASNAMSVVSAGDTVPAMVFKSALVWLAALGVIAILRGTQLLVKAGDGGGSNGGSDSDPVWTGCIYIVSGAIGVNLWRFVSGLI